MPATALVTGASSGIGMAIVEELARRDVRVVATVRSEEDAALLHERMRRLGLAVTTAILDVTDADEAARVIDAHRPQILVNNAGDALLGPVNDVTDADATGQLEVLTVAPLRLARLAYPHMAAQGQGRIVNISSMLTAAPLPTTGWYTAAKAALTTLTDVLRVEYRPAGITVVLVELGAIDTPAWDHDSGSPRFAATTKLLRPLFSEVTSAARAVADAATAVHPRPTYRAGFGAHLFALAGRTPTVVRDPLTRALFGAS